MSSVVRGKAGPLSCNLRCANQVEILWPRWVDSKPAELVTLEGFEDGRGRTSASPHWTENAPLRRRAIRSLTTRLNVPVVRWKLG